jgi:hypothetical protein
MWKGNPMRINSRLARVVTGTVLGTVALTVPTLATPAFATVNPSSCIYGFGNSPWGDHLPYKVSATCDNPTNSGWHAYAVCENTRGVDHTVDGFEVYGSGTSIAQCAVEASLASYGVVNG